jgi:hypothetical protein
MELDYDGTSSEEEKPKPNDQPVPTESVRNIVQLVWYRCISTSTCLIMHVVLNLMAYGILLMCDAPMCVCVIHS